MNDVERVDREELSFSRREIMAGSSVVAGAAVAGVMPRKVAAQQDPDNEISGTVTDAQGAVDGATVAAVPHDSSLDPLVTTTDSNGDYIFNESTLYTGDNLYHVIARDGTEASPRRGQENYPFLMANGGADIPDSEGLHARYDARELSLSDQDTVSTWPDETGNGHDLTEGTAPTYVADGINGKPVVRFDGADDFLDVAFTALSQPNHVFMVASFHSSPSGGWFDSESSSKHDFAITGSGEFRINAGTNLVDGGADQQDHIHNGLFNGSSSNYRIDGSNAASGDAGTNNLNGIQVGREVGGLYSAIDIGEILIYPEDKSGNESDIEQYLDGGWGPIL